MQHELPSLIPDDRYLLLGREGSILCEQEVQNQTREGVIRAIMSGQVEPYQFDGGIVRLIPGAWPQFGSWEDATREIAREVYERLIAENEHEADHTRALVDWCAFYVGIWNNGRFWAAPREAAE